jgi:predicted PurR-regulated permease PerM
VRAIQPVIFWIATISAATATTVLLHQILLPFVAGLVLAYLLSPLTNRVERLGASRLTATLITVGGLVAVVIGLRFLAAPILVHELVGFLEDFPHFVGRLDALAADPSRPWLQKLVGEGLGAAQQSVGELTTLGAA